MGDPWQRQGSLSACSAEAALWLRGYLEGSAPEAWFDDPDFDYADDDPRTELWREAVLGYQLTGTWVVGRECEECGTELLPSSPAGDPLCPEHGGGIPSCWPTVVPSTSHGTMDHDRWRSGWLHDEAVLADIGAALANQQTEIEVRLPRPLADAAGTGLAARRRCRVRP